MHPLPRDKNLKIILTQLPFRFYNLELTKFLSNIPLAAGFLKAMAKKEGLLKNIDIDILDPLTADIASDSMLLDVLISEKPDIIGFSLYLWNLARSLYIISEIKKILPETIVIVGGPDVTQELNYISQLGADFAVNGEGEMPFVQLLKHILTGEPELESINGLIFRKEGRTISNPCLNQIDDINDIPSPYLSGCLDPRPYRRYWLETMRWCSHRCKYCMYWQRSYIRNPFYSLERIKEELNYAKKLGVGHIDIHDSAFNLNPKFKEICGVIREVNKDNSFTVSVFLQAECLNEGDVELLAGLNISWAEIGLQSTNPETLIKIGRDIDLEKWLKGINFLKKKKIKNMMVDVMIGLPADDLKSILKTMTFLKRNKLDACAAFPALSVGPNTAIRQEAKELGIIRFQAQAPYFILGTDRMSFSDIRRAKTLSKSFTRKLPKDNIFSPYHDTRFPYLHTYSRAKYPYWADDNPDNKINEEYPDAIPITKIIIDLDSQPQDVNYFKELGLRLANRIANNLIVWFHMADSSTGQLKIITEFIKNLSKPNPYNIWNIIFEGVLPFSIQEERYIMESISFLPNNLDYREVYIKRGLGKKEFYRVSAKLFYILPLLGKQKKITPRVGENRKVFRSLYIGSVKNLQDITGGLYIGRDQGVLIDFNQKLNPRVIFDSLKLLKEKIGSYTSVRFKNLIFQKLWYKFFNNYAVSSRVNDDLILNINANKNENYLYLSHKRIMLDMTEFTLSLKEEKSTW